MGRWQYAFVIETHYDSRNAVILIDSNGNPELKRNNGLENVAIVLNELGNQGWEVVGFGNQLTPNEEQKYNLWTLKKKIE